MSTAERYLVHAAELRAKSEAERNEMVAKHLDHFAERYTRLAAAEAISLDHPEWIAGIADHRRCSHTVHSIDNRGLSLRVPE
jgi:hypothetical protein